MKALIVLTFLAIALSLQVCIGRSLTRFSSLHSLQAPIVAGVRTIDIRNGTLRLKMSEVLPGNILPQFLFQQAQAEGGSTGVKIGGGKGAVCCLCVLFCTFTADAQRCI
jgi:hypothetical protein